MTNQQGAPEAPKVRTADYEAGWKDGCKQGAWAPQQPAKAESLRQILTDPENQPNQYGVEFGMSGQQMHFKIGNQLFRLAYEPDDQQEFEFMKRMLIHAFSTFTPDVKMAQHPATHVQNPAEIEHVAGDVSKTGRIAELEDALSSCLQLVNQLNEHHIPDGCSRLIRHIKDAAATVSKAQASAQADSVTAPADGANWQDISTAPRDGTRFVAVGNNYGLYSETQHTCIAQWFRGCWMEVSDWNEASELKYLTHWTPLPPPPGSAASATEDSVTAPAGGAEESEFLRVVAAHAPTDSVLEDAARLDWLLLRISGAEFRRLGVHYSGNARRADVDVARKQGGST